MGVDKTVRKLELYKAVAIKTGNFSQYSKNIQLDKKSISEYIYNTNKIEGNPITMGDTSRILINDITQELTARNSEKDTVEIPDMFKAINFIYKHINDRLTESFIT